MSWLLAQKILEKLYSYDVSKKSKKRTNNLTSNKEQKTLDMKLVWWTKISSIEEILLILLIFLDLKNKRRTNIWDKLNSMPDNNGKIIDSSLRTTEGFIVVYTSCEDPESNKAICLLWSNFPCGLTWFQLSPSLINTQNKKLLK